MVHLTSLIHLFYGVWTQVSFFVDGLFTLSIKEEHTFAVCPTGVFVTLSRESRKLETKWENKTGDFLSLGQGKIMEANQLFS